MRVWLRVAWVCALAVGCGGPLPEESPPEEPSQELTSDEGAPEEVSALWKKPPRLGTPFLVEDIFPPPITPPTFPILEPLPTNLVDFRGTLFFAANGNALGASALWRSDGTAPGTFPVGEPEAPGSVGELLVVRDRLFFTASDAAHGSELWVSDGTSAGTRLLKDITPGPEGSTLGTFTRVGDTLFFSRRLPSDPPGEERLELWKSDGTPSGTVRVEELGPGFVVFNTAALDDDTLFFVFDDGTHGFEPWVSDGTSRGTRLLKDIAPGPDSSGPDRPTPVNGTLYFSAQDPAHGRELWRTDGTTRGTELVEDTVTGPTGSGAQPIALFKRRLYFVTFDTADRGARLRKLNPDPTCRPRSTVVEDLPNPFPDRPEVEAFLPTGGVAEVNGRLLFTLAYSTAGPALADVQLWATRGTRSSTVLLRRRLLNAIDIPTTTLTAVNDRLALFAAADDEHGQEPWVTDGTPRGTRLLADIRPGGRSSFPIEFTRSGDFMFFAANDGIHGHDLWAVPVEDRAHRDGR